MITMMVSCGDSCDMLDENIIGTWSAPLLGAGTFTFNEDGTVVDADDLLLAGSVSGMSLDMKTWRTVGDEMLIVRASDGAQFLEAELNVTSFDCDVIELVQTMVPFTFNRQ